MPDSDSLGTATTAAHLPAFFNVTIFELGKHAGWGATVGRRLLNGESDVWSDLHLFAVHAGTVGAFIQALRGRRRDLDRLFPGRADSVREVAGSDFDFGDVIGFRNGMSHIDERIERRWHQLASAEADPPDLHVRIVGALDDGRERLLNWKGETGVASFRTEDGVGWFHVDIEDVTVELERMLPLLTDSYMTRVLGPDWTSVVAKVIQGPPAFSGQIRRDPSKYGPKGDQA